MRREFGSFDTNNIPVDTDCQPAFEGLAPKDWPAQWRPSQDFPNPQTVGTDEFNQVVNQSFSFDDQATQYRLGVPELPIAPYREHILNTYRQHQTMVLAAETGSGKSTQVPLYLLEEYIANGDNRRLFVSSPRILPTRELQAWTQQSVGPDMAYMIGRLTGTAKDSDCHPDARVIFVTERLLLKLLARGKLDSQDDIMIDEAHELTKPMTVLAGVAKQTLPENPNRHIIVSSASIDTRRNAVYFKDPRTNKPAPIIGVPGRTHEVEFRITDRSVVEAARDYIRKNKNVLVFEPGIARMQDTASQMSFIRSKDESLRKNIVHLLYGDQSPREQKEALTPDDGHHTVANRVGETSVTPQGKDVVVSSGLSNVGGYEEGVWVLETVHASKAALTQQAGRVGRTKPGIHELAVPNNATPIAYDERPDFDPPEIQNDSVASEVAELIGMGMRLEDLDLLYAPTERNLRHGYKLLRRLGAIALVNDAEQLTDIGWQMLDLPLDMPQARSVIEARAIAESDNVRSEAIRLQACAIAAIQQVNGILEAWNNSKRRDQLLHKQKSGMSDERQSDVLFELDAFVTMFDAQRRFESSDIDQPEIRFERFLRQKDIKINPYYKTCRIFDELCHREGLDQMRLVKPTTEERTALIQCQIAGAEELFVQKSRFWHDDIRGRSGRQLGARSTIQPAEAHLVIGKPFDLRGMTDNGTFERRYISGASVVTTKQLLTYAAHRITAKSVGYGMTKDGEIRERQALYFDGLLSFDIVPGELSPTLETRQFLIRTMMTGASIPNFTKGEKLEPYNVHTPNAQQAIRRWKIAQDIEHRTKNRLNVDQRYESLINKIVRESVEKAPLDVTDPYELDKLIPHINPYRLIRPKRQKKISDIIDKAPDFITIQVEDDTEEQLMVAYKNGIALVTVPPELKFLITREHFTDLLAHHGVKMQIGSGQFKYFDAAFKALDEGRVQHEQRRIRRAAELKSSSQTHAAELTKQNSRKAGFRSVGPEIETMPRNSQLNKKQAKLARKREVRSIRRQARRIDWIAEYAE